MQNESQEKKPQSVGEEAASLKPKRKGRPKGSKNKDAPIVLVEKPGCPTCGCTKYRQQDGAKTYDRWFENIVVRNGQAYNYKLIRRVVCDECGQHWAVHELHKAKG